MPARPLACVPCRLRFRERPKPGRTLLCPKCKRPAKELLGHIQLDPSKRPPVEVVEGATVHVTPGYEYGEAR